MPDTNLALLRCWPELARDISHVSLGQWPTPVERLELPLGSALRPPSGGLWIKRDDLSGSLYGGNKTRKLEFLLAKAVEDGCEAVWTVGAIGSHHALATAVYAREQGLDVHIVHFPQPTTDHVLEILSAIASIEGVEFTMASSRNLLPITIAGQQVRMKRRYGERARFIPPGGASTTGILGMVNAALELAEQVEAGAMPEPKLIYVPMGLGGTFSGLWLGSKLAGLATEIIGVRVVDYLASNEVLAARAIRNTSAMLHKKVPSIPVFKPTSNDLNLRHTYFGEGYGVPSTRGRRAKEIFDKMGHGLDLTYTAKAAAGMLDELGRANISASGPVLFWQTLSSVDLRPMTREGALNDLPDAYKDVLKEKVMG